MTQGEVLAARISGALKAAKLEAMVSVEQQRGSWAVVVSHDAPGAAGAIGGVVPSRVDLWIVQPEMYRQIAGHVIEVRLARSTWRFRAVLMFGALCIELLSRVLG